jgi:hypothetical protein
MLLLFMSTQVVRHKRITALDQTCGWILLAGRMPDHKNFVERQGGKLCIAAPDKGFSHHQHLFMRGTGRRTPVDIWPPCAN